MLDLDPLDLLRLRALSTIKLAVELVQEGHGVALDLLDLPLDDAKTFELFQRGDTCGVFQFESYGMRALLTVARPDRFEDLIALNALYRPGPMDLIPSFCARKHGQEKIGYFHPDLEPLLKETYGIIVYQEQAMRIPNILAGFNLNEADDLHKAMGKKKPEIMAKFEAQFVVGCVAHGLSAKVAKKIWTLMVKFAGHDFNKSHATAYALIAYQTAYLKANYPIEYMAALISFGLADLDKAVDYIDEARRLGIAILPPDVQHSHWDFRVMDGRVRYGLGAIRSLRRKAVDSIVAARATGGPFASIFDFCKRVDPVQCNKKELEALIAAGAMDALPGHRAQLWAVREVAMKVGAATQTDAALLPDVPPWSEKKLLAREKETLGHYLPRHPLASIQGLLGRFITDTVGSLRRRKEGTPVRLGGVVVALRAFRTRTGESMSFLSIEDATDKVDVVLSSEAYTSFRHLCVPDAIVVVEGRCSYLGGRMCILADRVVPLEQAQETFAADGA